ncbi:KpsF/GutQ family protein [Parvibaculum lavamentivorans DS-1]|uniref:KpsF/GutQ family protein n=1 Tax=Parvibaculum lavamentivorans (strain DS-1 / DSM 13023 / NCIMB 13966) TaxID=402881 RepID=A7HUD3_PARL1|nr:KpsF/GutQ family sugar-phosphate isomerase [Parvibaculum lavamentivorans]ABS63516.1 KpsF/GutQ family protein [Parvibaculum lavamentivorans DS-1]
MPRPTDQKIPDTRAAHLASAQRTLMLEIEGLKQLAASLDGPFTEAVEQLGEATGRVIVTGMGKSGHIARKIAATLASTGTPAHYVHPGEASHGDLGMITSGDVILALSWSGETAELSSIISHAKRFAIPLVAMTAEAKSALGTAADIGLFLPRAEEACPNKLAPTTSTTMQLALGDALAMALLERKGFSARDFSVFHPGGKLGAMLRHVSEVMHTGDALPLAAPATPMSEVLLVMSQKSLGCAGIVDGAGKLVGVITDGDIRRNSGEGLLGRNASDIMNRSPKTVAPGLLASEAVKILNEKKITSLFVVEDGRPVGLVHIHDFLKAGVI